MHLLRSCVRESVSLYCITQIGTLLPALQSIPLITLSLLRPKPSSENKTLQSWQHACTRGEEREKVKDDNKQIVPVKYHSQSTE